MCDSLGGRGLGEGRVANLNDGPSLKPGPAATGCWGARGGNFGGGGGGGDFRRRRGD